MGHYALSNGEYIRLDRESRMLKNLARIYTADLEGIDARLIEVEVDLNVGLHAFNIVGLADKAVGEAKERVNSALKNSGIKPPTRENRKITVNLAPADVKKTGAQYDLPIALGYLRATDQIRPFEAKGKLFMGELALDGRLRPVNGALNIAQMAAEKGYEYLFLPAQNANEAAAVNGVHIIPLQTLQDAMDVIEDRKRIAPAIFEPVATGAIEAPDFSEVKKQENAKRALTIAAAGGHNLLMIGPPGVGKSLLAQALVGILPGLERTEAIEITKIWSAAGISPGGLIAQRPFRAPHQTASGIAIIGGGSDPKPGEVSLAHRGILFLDELPEFPKNVLETLRAPMESGTVHIARAKRSLVFPAKFSLIAAMNPCPCGYYGDPEKECICGAYEVIRYQKKISGPLLDRIDLQVRVPRVTIKELHAAPGKVGSVPETSAAIKAKVEKTRARQTERFHKLKIRTNGEMSAKQTEEFVRLDHESEHFLKQIEKNHLSPRGYYRLLKVARTIADIESSDEVTANHLAEAFSYRLREIV